MKRTTIHHHNLKTYSLFDFYKSLEQKILDVYDIYELWQLISKFLVLY